MYKSYPIGKETFTVEVDRGALIWSDLIRYFGTRSQLAQQLGLSTSSICAFEKHRGINANRALQIERITEGVFKASEIEGAVRRYECAY